MVGNIRNPYFGSLNRSGMVLVHYVGFSTTPGVLHKNPTAGIGKMSYNYCTSLDNLSNTLY
jgi:hypothetical protein